MSSRLGDSVNKFGTAPKKLSHQYTLKIMSRITTTLAGMVALLGSTACSDTTPLSSPAAPGSSFGGKRVFVAYFSWGGTTARMAQEIANVTGGTLYRIEPATPYPVEYTPCTEVAKVERDTNARPAIKGELPRLDEYDIVFLGGPVWWHTAPMILNSFADSYKWEGKTVIPFCTYASTYRDETLEAIKKMTPGARHLKGLGTTGSIRPVKAWVKKLEASAR